MNHQKMYALVFSAVLGVLLGAVFYTTTLHPPEEQAVAFNKLEDGQFLVMSGLGEHQRTRLKMIHLAENTPPDVGMFGDHLVQFLNDSAFKGDSQFRSFFNFSIPHLSTEELLDVLLYAEYEQNLPKKLLLVMIPDARWPTNELFGYYGNLTTEVEISPLVVAQKNFYERLLRLKDSYVSTIQQRINWANMAYAVSRLPFVLSVAGYFGDRNADENLFSRWVKGRKLNLTMQVMDEPKDRRLRSMGLRRDGSKYDPYKQAEGEKFFSRVLKENIYDNLPRPKDMEQRGALFGYRNINSYAEILNRINLVGKRNNRLVVFVVLPTYKPSDLNEAHQESFGEALFKNSDLKVLDHRARKFDLEYFTDASHPNPRYLAHVLKEIRENKWLSDDVAVTGDRSALKWGN